jgi:hypothetical protein
VIGVIPRKDEISVVEEFFQLFKTPWEMYRAGVSYDVILVTGDEIPELDARLVLVYGSKIRKSDHGADRTPGARLQNAAVDYGGEQIPLYGEALAFEKTGLRVICATTGAEAVGIRSPAANPRVVRIGFDLFQEVAFLLTAGQPVAKAHIPTLELHIAMLRNLILDAGISMLEIPPTPAGYDFTVCLTHDIDFVGIRRHKFDHTMWGFLYRSTAGTALDVIRHKIPVTRLIRNWKAAASLPFVYCGWMKDFWILFDWYLKVEKDLSPTYFLIPFKHRCGEKVSADHPERRATAYDITDIPDWTARLLAAGCEVGVHGIDAWHSVDKGREELKRVAAVTRRSEIGIRMHWLLRDGNTYSVLENAGYTYDSTAGYNETAGYRCGATQTFRPLGTRNLLELPLHIQDGALFYSKKLGLSESEAWTRCETFIANAQKLGGVLTVLWHDRSPGPERLWGDFYVGLVQKLKSMEVWFGNAGQVVSWFRKRREVTFQRVKADNGTNRVKLCSGGQRIAPPLRVRIHSAGGACATGGRADGGFGRVTEIAWDGENDIEPWPVAETSPGNSGPDHVSAGRQSTVTNTL